MLHDSSEFKYCIVFFFSYFNFFVFLIIIFFLHVYYCGDTLSLKKRYRKRLKSGTPKGLGAQARVIPETAFGFPIPLLL